ncbi:MAG: transcription termination/antitermination protein NusG [Candidatus Omnitrophica bacterium]|nr:transcription termination/antitermination protein NusG [Candidatus Omnitrophota bacterium]
MMNWYVIHTQTNLEDKVKAILENRIVSEGLQDLIRKVIIPTEQISEVRGGKKRVTERRFFPGYILVEMELVDRTYAVIKTLPGVSGFIGSGKKPSPLPKHEVDSILKRTEETRTKPSPKIIFGKGESIRVKEGPFMNFSGVIEDVYPEKGKLKVSISIFGRSTPVELEYWQVEKV